MKGNHRERERERETERQRYGESGKQTEIEGEINREKKIKMKTEILFKRAVNTLMRKGMGHTAVATI